MPPMDCNHSKRTLEETAICVQAKSCNLPPNLKGLVAVEGHMNLMHGIVQKLSSKTVTVQVLEIAFAKDNTVSTAYTQECINRNMLMGKNTITVPFGKVIRIDDNLHPRIQVYQKNLSMDPKAITKHEQLQNESRTKKKIKANKKTSKSKVWTET
eukprot:gene10119-2286_t